MIDFILSLCVFPFKPFFRFYEFCTKNFPSNFSQGPPAISRAEAYCSDLSTYTQFDLKSILGEKTGKNYAVIGGSGQVGKAIIRLLYKRGEYVRCIDLKPPTHMDDTPVDFVRADITSTIILEKALEGIHIVFLTAAQIQYQHVGPKMYPSLHRVNVTGTNNVLQCARANKSIESIIQTSTGYVVHGWDKQNMETYDENSPYTKKPFCNYVSSKIAAEKLIRSFNGTKSTIDNNRKILTCSIRPCSVVYSSEDTASFFKRYIVLYQNILKKNERNRGKKIRFMNDMIGEKFDDFIYADNVAYAHILAADNISSVNGQVFCISDGIYQGNDFTSRIFKNTGIFNYSQIHRFNPTQIFIWIIAVISAYLQNQWNLEYKHLGEVLYLTPTVINMVTGSKAILKSTRRVEESLGYRPIYSTDIALKKIGDELKKWYGVDTSL